MSFEYYGAFIAINFLQQQAGASKDQAESVGEAIVRHADIGETGNLTSVGQLIQLSTLFGELNLCTYPVLINTPFSRLEKPVDGRWTARATIHCWGGYYRITMMDTSQPSRSHRVVQIYILGPYALWASHQSLRLVSVVHRAAQSITQSHSGHDSLDSKSPPTTQTRRLEFPPPLSLQPVLLATQISFSTLGIGCWQLARFHCPQTGRLRFTLCHGCLDTGRVLYQSLLLAVGCARPLLRHHQCF